MKLGWRFPPARIPALLMSVETHYPRFLDEKGQGVLRKPFDLNGLLNVVSSILC